MLKLKIFLEPVDTKKNNYKVQEGERLYSHGIECKKSKPRMKEKKVDFVGRV